MSLHVVILAAGQGSRMKSKLPKVLHKVAGKPMLQHVLDTAKSLGSENINVVIGHGADQVKSTIEDEVNWCLQAEQLGTGHAVAQALDSIPNEGNVLILYGDVPFTTKDTLSSLIALVEEDKVALLTVDLEDPHGYGRIVRDEEENIYAIVEQKDASELEQLITEVNTGILALPAKMLHEFIPMLGNNNAQAEYYLTDIIELSVNHGAQVLSHQPRFEQEVQGVNNKLQLCELECWKQSQLSEQLMLNGVTLFDPHRIDIRGELSCGQDVTIDVNCVFEGKVDIADDVEIGPNCYFRDVTIGAGTVILANSVIEESVIGEQCNIGPFARMRPNTVLKNQAKIGNFVETKKTVVGNGSKINHLSYVGDSELGEKVNVGAGTITCNYDGVNKFKTIIEDKVFVGSNTSLVAPVEIKENSTIAAGSTITKAVEKDQLAVARSRQRNIDGWEKTSKK